EPRLVHDRALDVLADPPRRIGREAKAALGLELLDRVHETEVAFLDQVAHRQAAAEVVLRDADDQPQVVLDHAVARFEAARARRGQHGVSASAHLRHARAHRGGRSFAGSIGLPCLRISKWSCTPSASVEPISAIFCPRFTFWSSFTSNVWL